MEEDTHGKTEMEGDSEKVKKATKKVSRPKQKPGVVYLSCIPREMTVKRLREEFEKHAEVGNIFLQPDDKPAKSHCPYKTNYKEGWVEFRNKSHAKQVAAILNNNQVGGRQKNPWYSDLWNIKYLPKFQWAHLNARLAYEKGVYKQRLRADAAQIKREAAFHKGNFIKSKKKPEEKEGTRAFTFKQRQGEEEILSKKRKLDSGESEGGPKKRRRERVKKSCHRPDADHAVGALSLGANKDLMLKLFGGGGQ